MTFGDLDSVFDHVAATGWSLALGLSASPVLVAFGTFLVLVPLTVSGQSVSKLATFSLVSGVIAQASFLKGYSWAGLAFYGLGTITAFAVGRRLAKAPNTVLKSRSNSIISDLGAISIVLTLSTIIRLYSLEGIPWFVDVEAAAAYLESLSGHGMAHYVAHNRVLDDGYIHMLGRWAANQVIGPGIITLRSVSLGFGVLSVVLSYVVARQFVGVGSAFGAATLLAFDPAHLFWSRIEASQIIAASVGCFVSLLLALWMYKAWTLASVFAVALWTPITRYFYAGALGMAALPPLLVLLGIVRRDTRSQALRAAPILLLGSFLWFHSSSILFLATNGSWKNVPAMNVYGRPLLEPHDPENVLENLTVTEKALFQANRFVTHTLRMGAHMVDHRDRFSNWLMLAQPDPHHKRSINAALAAVLIPALAFVFGATRDARFSVLCLWLLATILPGVLSIAPMPRRLVGFMAGTYVVGGIFLSLGIARGLGEPQKRWFRDLSIVAALFVALTNLSSHLLTGRQRPEMTRFVEFVEPLFSGADVVYHNIEDWAEAGTLVYGNARVFRERLPCFKYIEALSVSGSELTHPPCNYQDPIYPILLEEEEISHLTERQHSDVAYLWQLTSTIQIVEYNTLLAHFPSATVRRARFTIPPYPETDVVVARTANTHQ